MWLVGGALWGWYGLQTLVGLNPPTPLETEGYAFAGRVAVGVVPLALVVSLGIVWGWVLLRRLFGRRVAWIAALLWVLDPFYLANSKALHLDATLSTLMILSALWMLIYLREHKRRQLTVSAILGGLAIATKISAIFLVPFFGFCLLVDWYASSGKAQSLVSKLKSVALSLLLWGLVAATVFVVLWPALWVRPLDSAKFMVEKGVLLHTGSTRDQPLFYRGELSRQDPGPGFYLDTLLFRTTFLSLPFALVGLLAIWYRSQEERASLLLLVDFAGFFFVQMSLSGWKDGRYMLPVLLVIDILAACGLIWWVGRLSKKPIARACTIGGMLLVQAILVFLHHPYYGTHYNTMAGGPRAAARVFAPAEWGEGLDLAGQYVDDQPGAEDFIAGTQFLANEMLAQHVRASINDIGQAGDEADYLVFGVQYTTRGRNYARWGKLWEETYKFREPEFVASLGGTPYAWVHKPESEPVIPQKMGAQLGESIRLAGYRLAEERLVPGDALLLTLYWRADSPIEGYYTVFVHLQGADGDLVAQQDNPPVRGTQPTNEWETHVLIEDPYEVPVAVDILPGEYLLSAGMYDPTTGERLKVADASGAGLPDNRIVLAKVQVQPAVAWWRWVLAGVWVAIVVLGTVLPLTWRRE
jgi:hypothetical protein